MIKLSSTRQHWLHRVGTYLGGTPRIIWMVPDDFGNLVKVDKGSHLGSLVSSRHH